MTVLILKKITVTIRNNEMHLTHSIRPIYLVTALLLMLTTLVSCSSTPKGVLNKDRMANLLADIYIGESVVDNESQKFRTDSAKRALRQSIYAYNGTTVEEVDSSFSWYGRHMDKYTEVYQLTIEILEKRLDKARSIIDDKSSAPAAVALDGDSVDIWPSARYLRFTPNIPADIISFNLSSDRYWEKGDTYHFHGKSINGRNPVSIRLAVDYFDGSTEYVTKSNSGNGWLDLTLVLDSSKVASNVYGTISYPAIGSSSTNGISTPVFLDSLSLYRTRWDNNRSQKMRSNQKVVKTK